MTRRHTELLLLLIGGIFVLGVGAMVLGVFAMLAAETGARVGRGEIRDQAAVLVEHLRPRRHGQLDRLAGRAVLERAAPGLAVCCPEPSLRAKRGQVAQVAIRDEDHVAAGPAVAAVRPTLRHVLLAPEVQAAVTAATRLHVDAGAVVEHEC